MKIYRRAWIMHLKEGSETAYDDAHAAVWPELTTRMIQDGICRFHLFRDGLTVFAVQERSCPFPTRDKKPDDVTRKWWQSMQPLMVTDETGRPRHTDLKEVFCFQTQDRQQEKPA